MPFVDFERLSQTLQSRFDQTSHAQPLVFLACLVASNAAIPARLVLLAGLTAPIGTDRAAMLALLRRSN